MKKILLATSIIVLLLSAKGVVAQEISPVNDDSSVVTSSQPTDKIKETIPEHPSTSTSASTSSSAANTSDITTQSSSTPTPSKSETKTSDVNTTTKKLSGSNFSLDGMTWQKVTGTGSEVNFGIAYQASSPVTFTWQYYDISTGVWVTTNENTSSNWISFKAPHAGQYLIHVSGTTVDGETKDYTIGWQVESEYVQLNGMTWQNVASDGSKTNFGIAYQTNSNVTFTWQYYDVSKKEWHVIASNTTSNWVSVQLPQVGDYLIYVEAKTANGQTSNYVIGWQVQPEYLKINGMAWNILSFDNSKANIGVSYTSNSDVTFTWQYYDTSKKEWHMIASNTGANWVTAQLPHNGDYLIYVEATTKKGVKATFSIGWRVGTSPTYFSQLDPRWANIGFNGSTIGPSGCVPTSLAMVLNGTYGMNVTPPNVANVMAPYCHVANGATGRDLIATANAYGRQVEVVSSQARAEAILKSGNPLIMFLNVGIGHAVVVNGFNNGSVEVLDPFNRQFFNGWYSLSYIWGIPSPDSMDWDAGRPVFAIK